MKRFISILGLVILCSGCASTVKPLPPSNSLVSSYRKTVEVVVVGCWKDTSAQPKRYAFKAGDVTVVESTETGERFNVHGCVGRTGDRFKVSY